MTGIVLDTHALVWWVNGDPLLSPDATSAINKAMSNDRDIIVSSISAWELAMLVDKGRLSLNMDIADWLTTVESIEQVTFVPVDNDIAVASVVLPGNFHKDPADRMIVATARKLGYALLTADEKIQKYQHVKTIW
ncbi:MAG: type II toxin-antitoxin system VapC family toxin [Alphaproteobacteria bacterium]|nr:MAG: type II toxin-antitoxin system VapC family toxin [Alphaproteobacteria bacterium]